MCYITLDSYFLLFILHILLFNRCVIINHIETCLDLFFKKNKSILHVLVSKKISAKFWPNFAKFGNFGGGRNFCDNEIKNLASDNDGKQLFSSRSSKLEWEFHTFHR